jgi:hypothetical protein
MQECCNTVEWEKPATIVYADLGDVKRVCVNTKDFGVIEILDHAYRKETG